MSADVLDFMPALKAKRKVEQDEAIQRWIEDGGLMLESEIQEKAIHRRAVEISYANKELNLLLDEKQKIEQLLYAIAPKEPMGETSRKYIELTIQVEEILEYIRMKEEEGRQ
jgi:hypothetical protein